MDLSVERDLCSPFQKLPYHVILEILYYYAPGNVSAVDTAEKAVKFYFGYFRLDVFRKHFLIFKSLWCREKPPAFFPARLYHMTYRSCLIEKFPDHLESLTLWSMQNKWNEIKKKLPETIRKFACIYLEETIPYLEVISNLPRELTSLALQDKSPIGRIRFDHFPELSTLVVMPPSSFEIPGEIFQEANLPITLRMMEWCGIFSSTLDLRFLINMQNLRLHGKIMKIRAFPPNLTSLGMLLVSRISSNTARILPKSLKHFALRKYSSRDINEDNEVEDDRMKDVDFKYFPEGLEGLEIRGYDHLNGDFLSFLRSRTTRLRSLRLTYKIEKRHCLSLFRLVETNGTDNKGIRSLNITNCEVDRSFFFDYSDFVCEKKVCSLRILRVSAMTIERPCWKAFMPDLGSVSSLIVQFGQDIPYKYLCYLPPNLVKLTLLGNFFGSRSKNENILDMLHTIKSLEYLRLSKIFGLVGKKTVQHILACKNLKRFILNGSSHEKLLKDVFVEEIRKGNEDLEIDNLEGSFHLSFN